MWYYLETGHTGAIVGKLGFGQLAAVAANETKDETSVHNRHQIVQEKGQLQIQRERTLSIKKNQSINQWNIVIYHLIDNLN